MNYVVSARKYRPSTFEEVIGQEHVTTTLVNALMTDKLAHAFLFCGPRGVGKTTCARLLAKLINMPDPKKAAQDGSYADTDIDLTLNIIELDAASNNSVEHIRTLIDQVRFQPQHGKYKVFIIDEVHMLSQAAFNAFLKTLEEPPPYAIFILATTEKHKILPTILSRCQLYDFRRIQVPEIMKQLKKIAHKENISFEEDALFTIAERADGAMRDALSIFDRIASATDQQITYKAVIQNLNLLDLDYYFRMTAALLVQDHSAVLNLFDEVLRNGFEGDTFINGLASHLRNLLYCKQDQTQSLFQVSNEKKKQYLQQSQATHFSDLLTFLNLANQCDVHYQRAKAKRLHCEIALLKMCYASNKRTVTLENVNTTEKKTGEETKVVDHDKFPKHDDTETSSLKFRGDGSKVSHDVAAGEQEPIPNIVDMVSPESLESQLDEDVPIIIEEKIPAPVKKGLVDTPALSSIEDLLSEVHKELESKDEAKRELVLHEIETIWNHYSQNSASPTTQVIFDQAILEIVNHRIQIVVPTNIAKEEILQEPELYGQLREHFNQPDLAIDVLVNRERFPDTEEMKPKKLYTTKEKYDHLVSQNPMLEDMVKKLKLKPDQDG